MKTKTRRRAPKYSSYEAVPSTYLALCGEWLPRPIHDSTASAEATDYEAGREIKLDFSRYDIVLRAFTDYSLDNLFEAIARNQCSEIAEKDGALTIEIIEKEEVVAS
jgi:hypothetical protein